MKRLLLILAGTLAGLAMLLVMWQPDPLKTALVRWGLDRALADQPMSATVSHVSGNVFETLIIKDLSIKMEETPITVDIARIAIGIRWMPLTRRRVELDLLRFENPVIKAPLGVGLPLQTTPKEKKGQPWEVSIDRLAVREGRLELRRSTQAAAPVLIIDQWAVKATMPSLSSVVIETFEGRVQESVFKVKGTWKRKSPASMAADLRASPLPIDPWARWWTPTADPLQATYNGQLEIQKTDDRLALALDGQLNDADIKTRIMRKTGEGYEADLRVDRLALQDLWRALPDKPVLLSTDLRLAAPKPTSRALDAQGRLTVIYPPKGTTLTADVTVNRGDGNAGMRLLAKGLNAGATTQFNLMDETAQGRFTLRSNDLGTAMTQLPVALPISSGTLAIEGEGRWQRDAWSVEADVAGADWVLLGSSTLRSLSGELRWDQSDGDGHVTVSEFQLKHDEESAWDMQKATLAIQRSTSVARLPFDLSMGFRNQTKVAAAGLYRTAAERNEIRLDSFMVDVPDTGTWSLAGRTGVAMLPGGVQLTDPVRLTHDGGTIMVRSFQKTRDALEVEAEAKAVSIGPWLRLIRPDLDVEGTLAASVTLRGSPDNPTGSFDVAVGSGVYRGWRFSRLGAEGVVEDRRVRFNPIVLQPEAIDQAARVTGWMAWPLQNDVQGGRLAIDIPKVNPKPLEVVAPGLRVGDGGHLTVDGVFEWSQEDWRVQGGLDGKIPTLTYEPWGLNLMDVTLDVAVSSQMITARKIYARTEDGHLSIKGKSAWPQLDFQIEGRHITLNKKDLIELDTDLNVHIGGRTSAPRFTGSIRPHEGTFYKPKKKKEEKKPESPQEGSGDDKPPSLIWDRTVMDIDLDWARRFWYRDDLTQIETSGDLRVVKSAGQQSVGLTGTVNILRGSYYIYGRDFVIEGGEVRFSGPPEINPLLNITAIYRSGPTVVYVSVSGEAKKPEINLRCEPPLPRDECMSVLVFGAPIDNLRSSRGDSNAQARMAQAAGGVLGGYLTTELRKAGLDLGLDVVRVEPDKEGSRLTLGRYIGSDLFVSFGRTIGEEDYNVITGEYYLSDKWTLIGETGGEDAGALDIEFKYPLNKPRPTQKKDK